MKDVTSLSNQSVQDIAASSKTSATAAGPTETRRNDPHLIDTINQVFSLFRINYHNQYHAAFGDITVLNQAKRLWKEALAPYSNEQILQATKAIIESAEYLPTLNKMLAACDETLTEMGLPGVRDAYLEAANAASPKNAQKWSHPAVYLAGKETGWYELSHQTEAKSFPHFAQAYRKIIQRLLAGETLEVDSPPMLEQQDSPPMSREELHRHLQQLRELLDT
jgi:hypothetical protein